MIKNYFFTLTFIILLGSFNVVSAQCSGLSTLTDTSGTITDGSGPGIITETTRAVHGLSNQPAVVLAILSPYHFQVLN